VPLVTRMAAATGEALEVRPPGAVRVLAACPGMYWARALQQRGPRGLSVVTLGADVRQQAAQYARAWLCGLNMRGRGSRAKSADAAS